MLHKMPRVIILGWRTVNIIQQCKFLYELSHICSIECMTDDAFRVLNESSNKLVFVFPAPENIAALI